MQELNDRFAGPQAVMAADISQDLRRVLDDLPDGVIFLDREWRITYANAMGRRISRIRPEDLNGPTHWELYPTTRGTVQEHKYRLAMEERSSQEDELYYEPFDLYVHWRAMPIESGIAVYYQDVTGLRRAQKDAAVVTRQLQQAFDVMTDGVAVLNREWRFTFTNRRAKDILHRGDELIGAMLWHEFPGSVYEGSPFVANYYRTMVDRVATDFEAFYPEPVNRWLHLQCRPSEDGIVVFFSDITQRKKDEEAIRSSEERYRVLTDQNPQAIWTGARDGSIDYANRTFLEYVGDAFQPGDRDTWLQAFAPDDRDLVWAEWQHCVRTGERYCIEARILRAMDGAARWWRIEASAVRDERGEIAAWIGTGLDIHDARLANQALHAEKAETDRQRAELEVIYRTAPVGLVLIEPNDFRYLRVNDRQTELLGLPREQILGRRVDDIVRSQAALENLRTVAAGGVVQDFTYETEVAGRPGEVSIFNVNYSPVLDANGRVRAISVAALDVSQLRKAERALVQTEKLAAVGRLASSISHEINNPLEAVTNLLFLLAHEASLAGVAQQYVKMAQDELTRVSQIVTQTLRFHRQANRPTDVSAAQLVDAVLNLYQGRLANSGIRVEASYSTATLIRCFENDIRQVLNNLIANAIDAMRTGGRLVVRAHDTRQQNGARAVRIAVADSGAGMSAETLKRLFEPFYTTKGLNGTGLGLWISQGIVERHGGQLRVHSTQHAERHGTVFALTLPVEIAAL